MNLDEIEDLIRRYLSAGIAVVLILIAPATGGEAVAPRGDPAVVTVGPTPTRAPTTTAPGDGADDPDLDARGPAGTTGPGLDDEDPAGDDTADADTTTANLSPSTDTRETDTPETDAPATDEPADRDRPSPTTTRAPADTTSTPTGTAPSAAAALGWGTPDREDDFASGLSQWELYEGPGYADQGLRSPEAVTVGDGVLTITGDASGTTGGMCWGRGQRYGRWEARVRAPASDPSYDALLLLWPDAEDFPAGGEIDFMEMQDPTRQRTDFFLHHGAADEQVNGEVEIDATRWHNWAVEWTPDAITAYVDGEQWFRTTDTATFPPGPMHLCIQMDWFPEAPGPVRESSMEVDWVRRYAVTGS